MKSWCDMSWAEKQAIREGRVNRHSYSNGYSFDVKQKVKAGQAKPKGETRHDEE